MTGKGFYHAGHIFFDNFQYEFDHSYDCEKGGM